MAIASRKPVQWLPDYELKVKPTARGWVHFGAAPLALAAGIVLVVLAPTTGLKWASAVWTASSVVLFGMSALYHLFYWAPPIEALLRRLDHANIFLLIAGTYTPLSVALLPPSSARLLLGIVWSGAVAGILLAVLWPTAPRWLSTVLYIVLGWTAIWFLPSFWANGSPAVVILIIVGGVLYTMGAVVYARKRPDPSPGHFGFHEIFHVFTVAAWACHCVAVYLAVLSPAVS